MTNLEESKYLFLGYDGVIDPPWNLIERAITQVLPAFLMNYNMQTNSIVCGKEAYELSCTEEMIRKEVREFYEENFTLHDVYLADMEYSKKLLKSGENIVDGYIKHIDHCKSVSVFDLPIKIDKESVNLMVGRTEKLIIPVPEMLIPESIGKKVSFVSIALNGKISLPTMVTYAHEIMHVLLESRPGYTEDLVYREVLSVFIECVFSAERLKREELKGLEKMRTTYETALLMTSFPDRRVEEDEVVHALGSLMGLKLYEKYSGERKEKVKRGYFKDIQEVMDGNLTVEELLKKRGVTVNSALDPAFIKRHL